jgi:hypothetical protein
MRIQEIADTIDFVIRAAEGGEYITLYIHGPSGIGKSKVVWQAGERHGMQVLDVRTAIKEAVDFSGGMDIEDGLTYFRPPAWLPRKGRGILFLDEHAQAMISTQSASSSLIYDRTLGDYTLPPGWIVILAGNNMSDRAATNRTPQHINNRCIHIDAEVDHAGWKAWAVDKGLDKRLIAFLSWRVELLHKASPDARAFPTPRSWEFVNTIIKGGLPRSLQFELISGTVGQGPASEMMGFLDVYGKLPRWEEVFDAPVTAELPEGPANSYALMSVLSHRVTIDTIDALVIYLRRISRELGNLCMTDAGNNYPVLKETSAYTQWAIDNHI